ncbi:antitoxin HicB [Cryobacterium zhongshanensis]|uniref:Antitoxin HicB n=1 Tax=Cryobacterium zhongshanensis TaxID=2928153 RepID=A0AA41UDY9_9MICO|nr:antitoxin HicB [Cryobacterium zhongshanensis]MCI4656873.1 antitoxin HicB [Cryobacterium zhongshanensis]
MTDVNRYTYRVTWSGDDNEYVGLVAEYPSLSWLAAERADALVGIRNLVANVVADLKVTGENLPGPAAQSGPAQSGER